jgi:hypothetical protein
MVSVTISCSNDFNEPVMKKIQNTKIQKYTKIQYKKYRNTEIMENTKDTKNIKD